MTEGVSLETLNRDVLSCIFSHLCERDLGMLMCCSRQWFRRVLTVPMKTRGPFWDCSKLYQFFVPLVGTPFFCWFVQQDCELALSFIYGLDVDSTTFTTLQDVYPSLALVAAVRNLSLQKVQDLLANPQCDVKHFGGLSIFEAACRGHRELVSVLVGQWHSGVLECSPPSARERVSRFCDEDIPPHVSFLLIAAVTSKNVDLVMDLCALNPGFLNNVGLAFIVTWPVTDVQNFLKTHPSISLCTLGLSPLEVFCKVGRRSDEVEDTLMLEYLLHFPCSAPECGSHQPSCAMHPNRFIQHCLLEDLPRLLLAPGIDLTQSATKGFILALSEGELHSIEKYAPNAGECCDALKEAFAYDIQWHFLPKINETALCCAIDHVGSGAFLSLENLLSYEDVLAKLGYDSAALRERLQVRKLELRL